MTKEIPSFVEPHLQTAELHESGYIGVMPREGEYVSVHHDEAGKVHYNGSFDTYQDAKANYLWCSACYMITAALYWSKDESFDAQLADWLLDVGNEMLDELGEE